MEFLVIHRSVRFNSICTYIFRFFQTASNHSESESPVLLIYVLAFHRRHYIITSLPDNSEQNDNGMTKWQNGAMKKWRNGDMAMHLRSTRARLLLRVGSPDLLFHSIDLGLGVEFGLIDWMFEPIVPARHESRATRQKRRSASIQPGPGPGQDTTHYALRSGSQFKLHHDQTVPAGTPGPSVIIRHTYIRAHWHIKAILGFHNAYAAFSFSFRHSKPTRRKRVERF